MTNVSLMFHTVMDSPVYILRTHDSRRGARVLASQFAADAWRRQGEEGIRENIVKVSGNRHVVRFYEEILAGPFAFKYETSGKCFVKYERSGYVTSASPGSTILQLENTNPLGRIMFFYCYPYLTKLI